MYADIEIPWVEKYRPATISAITHQEEVVHFLQEGVLNRSIPHLLFYGPPGTGKTSAILAACRELYGSPSGNDWKYNVLELNASDERGIKVVRDKVKGFAMNKTKHGFKIIILDEADQMTVDAQSALRRVIEQYTVMTRFVMICNYISKIIDPLISRCICFRFKKIEDSTHLARLQYICQQEQCNATESAFKLMLSQSNGDMRKSITTLESCSRLYERYITEIAVREVTGMVPRDMLENSIRALRTRDYSQIKQFISELMESAYSIEQFYIQMLEYVVSSQTEDIKKCLAVQVIAAIDAKLSAGADQQLQLMNAFMKLSKIFS